MDVSREEYVADLRAIAQVIALQQSVLRRLVNASLVKDEVDAEKERKAAYRQMEELEEAVKELGKRVDVTSMLGDLSDEEWEIVMDKFRGQLAPEEGEEAEGEA
jgi:hypothetical protein